MADYQPLGWRSITERRQQQAIKGDPKVIWDAGYGGSYGEPPPTPVTATPTLYVTSGPVFESVNTYAHKVQTTPFKLLQLQPDGELEQLNTHPALEVIRNPNEFMSRSELFWRIVSDTQLNGNHWWFLGGPAGSAPTEIWPLDPRYTRLVRSATNYIDGYITDIEGKTIPLERNEVIHYRRPSPFDQFYGLGALAAAALAAQTGRDMGNWNRNIFGKNYAIPAGIVAVEGNINNTDFSRLKSDWLASYGSGQRKTAFLRGGVTGKVTFETIGLSQNDVDFLNGIQWEAETVYRIFDCHHLRSSQYADDAKNLERMFLDAVWATLEYVAEVITDEFLPFWADPRGPGKLVFKFDDVRPRDRALELSEKQEESKGQTLAEWRKAREMEPLDGDDKVMFVHVQQGEKVEFERAALPEPEPEALVSPVSLPVSPEPIEDEAATQDAEENANDKQQAGQEFGDDIGEQFNKSVDPALVHRELKQWERFTLKRLDSGQDREFAPDHVPGHIANLLVNALEGCVEVSAVKAIFQRVHDLSDGKLSRVDFEQVPRDIFVIAPESMKAIQSTRLDFESDFADLLEEARNGSMNRGTWSQRMRTLLRKYGELAFRDGLNDGGVSIEPTEPLDNEDRATVNAFLAEQGQYVTEFGKVLYDKKSMGDLLALMGVKAITDAQAELKPSMWFNKSVDPLYKDGRLSADKNGMYEWVLGPTEESCSSCLNASGQRHRLKQWHARGIIPQTDALECNGFECKCRLVPTKEKARGRFTSIPLKALGINYKHAHPGTKADEMNSAIALLYLDRVDGLLEAQEKFAELAKVAGVEFEPVPRDELHITLVYANDIDDHNLEAIGTVVKNTGFQQFKLETGPVTWFGDDEQRKALVYHIKDSDLQVFQERVFEWFAMSVPSMMEDLSEYSHPSKWQSHVTIGYSKPFDVAGTNIEFDAVRFAVARDDYQNVVEVEGIPNDEIGTETNKA